MLPSQGLFRSIPCPFFLSGLCERPHCSFRHCGSDIRIDRKLEAEAVEETKSPSQDPAKSADGKSVDANSESKTERLNTTKPAAPKEVASRKRSSDSESKSSSKRRKVSSGHEEMGGIVGKVKGIVASATNSCSAKSDSSSSSGSHTETHTRGKRKDKDKSAEDDIDRLVEEIEKTGSSSSNKRSSSDAHSHGHHHKSKKSHKHSSSSHHRHSSHHKDGDKSSSGSHRKENCSSRDDKHRSSGEKRESSKKESSRGSSGSTKQAEPKRRKDSNESGSSNSSSHKRIRQSSEGEEGSKSREGRHSSSRKKTSSTPKKEEKKEKAASGESKGESKLLLVDTLKSSNNIDTTNRFNVLAESSAEDEESAYNSDVFDESLDFQYPGGSDSEDDPDMVARECLELFENYKPEEESSSKSKEQAQPTDKFKKEEEPDEGFCVVGKKRVAHANTLMKAPSTPLVPSTPPPPKLAPVTSKNLQDQLLKRFDEQNRNKTIIFSNGGGFVQNSTSSSPKPGSKMRIAHVPNAGKLAQKPVIGVGAGKGSSSPAGKGSVPGQPGSLTYSQTAAKGVKREAHKSSPVVTSKQGPIVFRDAINKSTKIPHVTRQQIMDKMFAEYSRLMDTHEQAFQLAISRENELIGKCSSKQVYYSSGISIISGLRKASKQDGESVGGNRVVSHQDILSGGSLESRNCSVLKRRDGTLPTGNALYKALRKYFMTEQQLVDNGYPRPHPSGENGRALAKPRPGEENCMTLTNRICDRCKKRYVTTEDGQHVVSEVCNYHWGRKFTTSSRAGRGNRECNYVCCGSDDDKIGCVTSICHVSKCPVPISQQKGFVEAVLEEGPEEQMGTAPWDIIGIDCEMVYTTHGNELARVTIVGVDRKVLYDEIVKPTHRVLDCNSRFSGITFDDMDKARRTITEVQAIILTHLRPNTILIGHSLESDLIALRLKHDCVIDTSILYPHKLGPPKKRALKNLSAEILKKVIQESDSGHDSAEDAQIAVELVINKLKSDCASATK